jgi:hypothetical protein
MTCRLYVANPLLSERFSWGLSCSGLSVRRLQAARKLGSASSFRHLARRSGNRGPTDSLGSRCSRFCVTCPLPAGWLGAFHCADPEVIRINGWPCRPFRAKTRDVAPARPTAVAAIGVASGRFGSRTFRRRPISAPGLVPPSCSDDRRRPARSADACRAPTHRAGGSSLSPSATAGLTRAMPALAAELSGWR